MRRPAKTPPAGITRLPSVKSGSEVQSPEALQCLVQEHRHFSALLTQMEKKSRQLEPAEVADHYLLRDIAGYLHDYPAQVHHPTEDLLFGKLARRKPALRPVVKGVHAEHAALVTETGRLIDLLEEMIAQPEHARARVLRRACREFVDHQRKHMQLENEQLFPAAIEALSGADWQEVAACLEATADPLFGIEVAKQHRLLFEYMLGASDPAATGFRLPGVFLLERMVMAMDTLGQGRDAWLDRVNALMGEVTTGTFSLAQAAIRQRQAGPIFMLPARLAATLLKSVLAGSGDLLKISGGTAWRFMAGFIAPENPQARKPVVSKTRTNPGPRLPPATAQTP